MSNFDQQLAKIKNDKGFIAALDQSGGSTPKALKLYGLGEDAWKNEQEMYDVVHKMRTRMITSPAFSGKRLIGAILFENTMDRDIDGKPTPTYLWNVERRRAVPQGRQGPRRREGRRAAHEADRRASTRS